MDLFHSKQNNEKKAKGNEQAKQEMLNEAENALPSDDELQEAVKKNKKNT
ncbi:small, acid-soluble spore protein, SspJ family [Tuberibacillus sp. Marseille-P3662]|nr:small, acid-soluble spore protein, SspJ family [Tuberibacillus sp. Marseille-P3662]